MNFLGDGCSYINKPKIRLTKAEDQRFDSWKEISLYLGRTIRTCYRWHQDLGLPVYRVNKKSIRSRVFAYQKEIDEWFKRKSHTRERKARPLRGKRRSRKN